MGGVTFHVAALGSSVNPDGRKLSSQSSGLPLRLGCEAWEKRRSRGGTTAMAGQRRSRQYDSEANEHQTQEEQVSLLSLIRGVYRLTRQTSRADTHAWLGLGRGTHRHAAEAYVDH
jgi:hypothetical protein